MFHLLQKLVPLTDLLTALTLHLEDISMEESPRV